MRVHVFESMTEPDLYGFTSDRSGNNLPPRGEWKYFKTIEMSVGETPRWGVSTEKALEAIEKDGFYLTTGQIRLKMQHRERRGDDPWVDTTQREIDWHKKTIGMYEGLIRKLRAERGG